jgi:hypothetical protein
MMMEKASPDFQLKYLIDECVTMVPQDIAAKNCINCKEILPEGTPDEAVLEEATKRGLIVITNDIRFVLNTVIQNRCIVYQNNKGERHYIKGSSELIAKNCKRRNPDAKTKYLLLNDDIIFP